MANLPCLPSDGPSQPTSLDSLILARLEQLTKKVEDYRTERRGLIDRLRQLEVEVASQSALFSWIAGPTKRCLFSDDFTLSAPDSHWSWSSRQAFTHQTTGQTAGTVRIPYCRNTRAEMFVPFQIPRSDFLIRMHLGFSFRCSPRIVQHSNCSWSCDRIEYSVLQLRNDKGDVLLNMNRVFSGVSFVRTVRFPHHRNPGVETRPYSASWTVVCNGVETYRIAAERDQGWGCSWNDPTHLIMIKKMGRRLGVFFRSKLVWESDEVADDDQGFVLSFRNEQRGDDKGVVTGTTTIFDVEIECEEEEVC